MKFNMILVLAALASLVASHKGDFRSEAYNKLSRQEKFDKLWTEINANKTPNSWYSSLGLMKIFFISMDYTMDVVSDAFPDERGKFIHTVGVTGHAALETTQDQSINPYTGIFKGCDSILLRLSLAKKPDEGKRTADQAEDNFTPGFGIKFLRDGRHSGNTVSMFGVNGQNSWNWFKNDFSNHIPPPEGLTLKALELKFRSATKWTAFAGLKDMALYDQEGKDYSNNLKFPYKLIWKPNPDLKNQYQDYFTENFMTQLERIPENTILYSLWVTDSPFSPPVQIGQLKLVKSFRRSMFGDKDLFFRHGRMEDDFAFHPEWMQKFGTPEFNKAFLEEFGFEHP